MTIHELQPIAARRPGIVSVDGKAYPLESVRVEARAEGGVAVTKLVQAFGNPHDEALEVEYTMPLPADGAVLGYTVRVGEKVIRAEVQPREKADEAYRKALYEGRTAGLLEQDRADTFRQRLGNVPPRTPVEVTIEVLQPLAFLAALEGAAPQWEYRFPTVVGVRYEGAPGRVPDAERLDPDRGATGDIPARVALDLAIADVLAKDAGVASPSHGVEVEHGPGGARVRFAAGERLDRDIVVRWDACAAEVGVRVVEGRGLEGDKGRYGLVTIVPPAVPGAVFTRDLTVLIDASGSMSGAPLESAKRVVEELLRGLAPGDCFEVLAFSTDVVRLTKGMAKVDERPVADALRALAALTASGGTEMAHAVTEALRPLRADSQRQVVLVTDGYIGFEAEVVGRLVTDLPRGSRVHAVGVGSAPNRTLVSGVARAGRGAELYAGDEATAAEAGRRLHAATARPVLTEVTVEGTAVPALAPARPRDVFAGQPLVFTVELREEGGLLEIGGRLAGATERWSRRVEVPAAGAAAGLAATPLPIGALHGREAIADLELKIAAQPGSKAVEREIEARGMRHRIASRFTSLVAIAEEPSADPTQPRRSERLAVELPHGVSAEGAGLAGAGILFAMARMSKGAASAASMASLRAALPHKEVAHGRSKQRLEMERPLLGETGIHRLRVVSVTREPDGVVVVEFETPFDGFTVPRGRLDYEVDGYVLDTVEVVAESSSPEGPHAKGLVVRLALRLPPDAAPGPDKRVSVLWEWTREARETGPPIAMLMRLDLQLPPEAGRTARP